MSRWRWPGGSSGWRTRMTIWCAGRWIRIGGWPRCTGSGWARPPSTTPGSSNHSPGSSRPPNPIRAEVRRARQLTSEPGLCDDSGSRIPDGKRYAMSEVVRAEMVANVAEVNVKLGERIDAGGALVLLESMKMEIPVLCEFGGTVAEIHVKPGDVIQEGDVIAVLD